MLLVLKVTLDLSLWKEDAIFCVNKKSWYFTVSYFFVMQDVRYSHCTCFLSIVSINVRLTFLCNEFDGFEFIILIIMFYLLISRVCLCCIGLLEE